MKILHVRKRFAVCFIVCAMLLALRARGHENNDLAVLPPHPDRPQSEEMMRSYLRRLTHDALDRRIAKYESLKTVGHIEKYQRDMKLFFRRQLGDFPQRTPLNARVVGKKTFDGYRIEKIIFESAPGFYVAAILYLPLSEPPYPAVLHLCGHIENGKAAPIYQQVSVLFARNGFAALCPDPIGQGERKQVLDENGCGKYRATTEHIIDGVAPILLGRNLATYMIWDGMRAIDYLVSRPDIDSTRIGVTGNSGGGNRTSYLMALDSRIKVAAPSCFLTTTRRKNESPGPGDAEQNIHAQIAYGMDFSDYIIMRAPKPTLVLSATRDFLPILGAWETYRQANRIYTRMGFPERVGIVETDARHGFSLHLRVGAVRWMRRWLMHIDDVVTEGEFTPMSGQELQCTPQGQVLLLPGAKSIFDLNVEKEKELAERRKRLWSQMDREELRARIRSLAGIRKRGDLPAAEIERVGLIRRPGYRIEKIVIRPEQGIHLPALLFQPDKPKGDPILYVHDEGKQVDAAPGGAIEKFVHAGHVVLAVDLRGIGETRTTPWRYTQASEFIGAAAAEFFIAYMLDKSFVGMRAEDILTSAIFLANAASGKASMPIQMVAIGHVGSPALHAMALEPQLFQSLTLDKPLVSWSDVVHTPVTRGALVNVVHGALQSYDVPDLTSLIGSERIIIGKP